MAAERFPEHGTSIQEVREQGVFGPEYLHWIASCLPFSVRLTMGKETHAAVQRHLPDIQIDAVYGAGNVGAHLYFSFKDAREGGKQFGHYDALIPCDCPYVLAKYFARLVPWAACCSRLAMVGLAKHTKSI